MAAPDGRSLALSLFERHASAVRRYMRRLTGDSSVADDLTQEVFLRVVRSSHTYEPRDRDPAWVFRIARNVLRDRARRARRAIEDGDVAEGASPPRQILGLDLRQALSRLPPDDREALLLSEGVGLKYAEIAARTGTTVAGVRSRIYRARHSLRAQLIPPPPPIGTASRGTHED